MHPECERIIRAWAARIAQLPPLASGKTESPFDPAIDRRLDAAWMEIYPVQPGDPEQSPPERYLNMARLLTEAKVVPELRRSYRTIYRSYLRELRADTDWILEQCCSSETAAVTAEQIEEFRRTMARNIRRLWFAWFLHALHIPAARVTAERAAVASVRTLATMHC